jgi:hypothetical protein
MSRTTYSSETPVRPLRRIELIGSNSLSRPSQVETGSRDRTNLVGFQDSIDREHDRSTTPLDELPGNLTDNHFLLAADVVDWNIVPRVL